MKSIVASWIQAVFVVSMLAGGITQTFADQPNDKAAISVVNAAELAQEKGSGLWFVIDNVIDIAEDTLNGWLWMEGSSREFKISGLDSRVAGKIPTGFFSGDARNLQNMGDFEGVYKLPAEIIDYGVGSEKLKRINDKGVVIEGAYMDLIKEMRLGSGPLSIKWVE